MHCYSQSACMDDKHPRIPDRLLEASSFPATLFKRYCFASCVDDDTLKGYRFMLQSRSQVTAEAEIVLSELVHHLTRVAKNAAESTQPIQSAAHLLTFSRQMLSRLRRYA